MPRKPIPPTAYPARLVAMARKYLCTHYPKQAEAIAALSAHDAVRCMASREAALVHAKTDRPYLARPAGVRRRVHAQKCGQVGGMIGGRILTPASLAQRRAASKVGAAARKRQARSVRKGAK